MPKKTRKIDMMGLKFHRLHVIGEGAVDKRGEKFWECVCDCGSVIMVLGSNLRTGNSKSCGCYNAEQTTTRSVKHGMRNTRMYHIWAGVRKRIFNPKMTSYHHYGGRGIEFCKEWNDFLTFYEDMKSGYAPNLSLERIDPDGNYCKDNCRWATSKEQARNKRNSVYIEYGGKKRTVAEWEEISGTNRTTISWRLKNNWSIQEAIYGKPEDTELEDIRQYLVF